MTRTARRHILLVDDEIHFCKSLKLLLEANGYSVAMAHCGGDAIKLLTTTPFQAVLLDIGLPDVSGNEIASLLHQQYPGTATIILTGNATLDCAIDALRERACDFLRKPCDPDDIIHAVNRAIELKGLEIRLQESENRFRQLAEATWEGILVYEAGIILETNSQLCTMFGYQPEELIGCNFLDLLLHRDSIRSFDTGLLEATGRKKDGLDFPVEIRVKKMEHQGRGVQVAAIRDISRRKELEEKRIAMEKRLADARRMESLGLMAGGVAHDLNNILSGVITYPDLLLLDMGEDNKYREEITMIREAGQMAAAVVNELLLVARGQNCKKSPQDLNEIVSTYLHSMECRELHRRYPGLRIQSELSPAAATVLCSGLHLTKALMNLTTNGAEAIAGQGSIIIKTELHRLLEPRQGYERIEPGYYAAVSVQDSGPGIAPQDLHHIFEPFYSKKKMGRSGTGLGLAMVWNTVRDHHGFIDVASDHSGCRFTLFFPVHQEAPLRLDTPSAETAPLSGQGEKILVVDDQPHQREIARRLLTRLGYTPYLVKSGEEAVLFVQEHPMDLIMLDMLMDPGMDGCETFSKIRAAHPRQKAILVSGYSSDVQINHARELGIARFVKKPYSLPELSQAIRLELKR